jgi:6-pyruvoyltetrahydropterin/6-carboxytetrahydropterin synthase
MFRPEWSDEENLALYGKCSNPDGHGHNYVLEVTLKGAIDPKTDMVMNLSELNRIMEASVVGPMDHRNLSTQVDFLSGINTTAENLAVAIWEQLERALPPGLLAEVRLQETENNVAVYRGESHFL